MTIQDDVREEVDELFSEAGKAVTFIKKSQPIYNTRGEQENVTNTSSAQTVIPYNITQKELNQLSFGNLPEGTMILLCRYDLAVDIGDMFTIESETWRVVRTERHYLPENVGTLAAVVREHA
jgi:hypothetical protein